ncbi:MAG: hypothetical protein QOI49_2949 [Verrucomicrobiota bacterium]
MSTLSLDINRIFSRRTVCQLLWLLLLPAALHAQEEKSAKRGFVSPDKQWECRVIDEIVVLLKAGSDAPVLNLNEEIGQLALESGALVWAPDSRRFAFNSRGGGKSYVCDLYELAGTTWKKLPDLFDNAKPVHPIIDRSLRRQLKKLGARRDATLNMVMSQWRARRWLDNDTFEAYVGEGRRVMVHETDEDWEYLGCAVLFRGKCDNRGGWKVTSSRELSEAEGEKINQADD